MIAIAKLSCHVKPDLAPTTVNIYGDRWERDANLTPFAKVRLDDEAWLHWYPLFYNAASRRAREENRERRAVAARHRLASKNLITEQAAIRQVMCDRAKSRTALIDLRMQRGFEWRSGIVGGNHRYRRAAFTFRGLVSNKHALLKLFASKVPRARNLATGHSKEILDGTDSKLFGA